MLSTEGLEVRADDEGDELLLLRDVDLRVGRGERLGVIGESGSGKTTLVRALIGMLRSNSRVSAGSIEFDGSQVLGAGVDERVSLRGSRISMVFQNPRSSLDPLMRVGAQIREVLLAHGVESSRTAAAKVDELLRDVGFEDPDRVARSYPHQLSGGMCQRASIAVALASEPELLIADECTSALDVTGQAEVIDLLARISHERGLGLIFVTHDIMLAAELCSRIAVMYGGQIVETGTSADVMQRPCHQYTRALLDAVPRWTSRAPLRPIAGAPEVVRVDAVGCRFAARCAAVQDSCRKGEVPMTWSTPTRGHRCLYPVTSR